MTLHNTSHFPDELIRQWIKFICGGRLPPRCEVRIIQGSCTWTPGRGSGAVAFRSSRGRPARAHGGTIFLRACRPHRSAFRTGGKRGYLPMWVYGDHESAFSTLAHEIRHVHQGYRPLFRECRKVRKHTFGTAAKLTEIDACLFEIRSLRRFRREFPTTSPAVLPLP